MPCRADLRAVRCNAVPCHRAVAVLSSWCGEMRSMHRQRWRSTQRTAQRAHHYCCVAVRAVRYYSTGKGSPDRVRACVWHRSAEVAHCAATAAVSYSEIGCAAAALYIGCHVADRYRRAQRSSSVVSAEMPRDQSIGPPREGLACLPSGPIVSIRLRSLQADALLQSLAHLEPMRNDDVRRCSHARSME